MPTYEYVCSKCNHVFEKVQSMRDSAIEVCPKELCPRKPWGKGKVRRVMGAGAGLIFKGSGFYITDYRSEKYKDAAKKDSGAAAPAPAASESKPAEKNKAAAPSTPTPSPAPAKSESKPKPSKDAK